MSVRFRCGFPYPSNTGSIRDDPYWTSRENSLEMIELLTNISQQFLVHS